MVGKHVQPAPLKAPAGQVTSAGHPLARQEESCQLARLCLPLSCTSTVWQDAPVQQ